MTKLVCKFFRSDIVMSVAYLMVVLGSTYRFLSLLVAETSGGLVPLDVAFFIVAVVFSTVVFCTYRSHDKNIMKPAMGMLMGALMLYSINSFFENVLNDEVMASYINGGVSGYVSLTLELLAVILLFVFCVVHLLLNRTHDGDAKMLHINKIITLALLAIYVVLIVFAVPVFNDIEKILYSVAFYMTLAGVVVLIMNIESKIDNFRKERAEAKKENV